MLEDYFVQNIYYDENPIFMGAPNKKKHLEIFKPYFGRIRKRSQRRDDIAWESIRYLVEDMFHNNRVRGTFIGFYGGNGFCLFSYFVRGTTPYRWFSMAVLFTNLVCVVTIGVCYVMINILARKSSSATASESTKNMEAAKKSRKLGRKIAIIVVTDVLTWLPFIIVCIINFTELIDASNWYSVFCIFFLPINALINPIGIYDETIYCFCRHVLKKLKGLWHVCVELMRCQKPVLQEEIEMTTQVRSKQEEGRESRDTKN
jgi:hypothetical protein